MSGTLESIEKSIDLTQLKTLCDRLAQRVGRGDCILLYGPLGSGKTQFVTCLAEALNCTDQVSSPTYGLANFYHTDSAPILHIDTYRLADQAEFRQLGLDEYFDSHLVLVEWADKVRSVFEDPLEVTIAFPESDADASVRQLTLSWQSKHWQAKVEHALQGIG